MRDMLKTVTPRAIGKWCACALVLLAPGSFIVVPALWLVRTAAQRLGRRAAPLPATTAARAAGLPA